MAKSVGIIFRLKHCLPPTALLNLYYAIAYGVRCYIVEYRFQSAYPQIANSAKQSLYVRVISRSGFRDHVTPHNRQLKILKINQVEKLELSNLSINVSINRFLTIFIASPMFQNLTITVLQDHQNMTTWLFRNPHYRTKPAQISIKYGRSKLWNSIPAEIKKLNLNQYSC